MARFYSIPGVRIHQRSETSGRVQLPPLEANPRLDEWRESRSPTSHTKVGIDGFNHFRGDVARVEGEEHDQHSGEVTQWVQRSDPTGSGTYKVTWAPEGPRTLVVKDTKRVHE